MELESYCTIGAGDADATAAMSGAVEETGPHRGLRNGLGCVRRKNVVRNIGRSFHIDDSTGLASRRRRRLWGPVLDGSGCLASDDVTAQYGVAR